MKTNGTAPPGVQLKYGYILPKQNQTNKTLIYLHKHQK